MVNKRPRDLTDITTPVAGDVLPIDDTSLPTSTEVKKVDVAELFARANHTGTQTASTISDLDTSTVTFSNKTMDGDLNTFIDINETQQNVSVGVSGTVLTSNGVGVAPTYQAAGAADNLGDHTATESLKMAGFDIENGGVIFLTEQVDAEADVAGKGQIWVNTATPNELFFTDDAGTDFQVAHRQNKLDVFAAISSAELAGVLSDEAGSGLLVFGTSPTIVTPTIAATGWTNANHAHLAANSGGTITEASISDLQSYLLNVVEDTTPQLGGALDGQGNDLNNMGVLFLTEQAEAEADVAGKGQVWVDTATPNILKFTDDAGTDFTITNTANKLDVFAATTKAELETVISDVTDFAEADGDTYSGAHLFNAATMRIPLSATPTMAVDGDFAIDTTVTDFSHGVMKFFDGEEVGVVAMPIAEFTTPTDGNVVAYNATNDEFELVAAAAASLPVVDTTSIVEGSIDATKEIRFEVDGLTASTVRVLTPPDADITIAGINIAQIWSATQTFDSPTGIIMGSRIIQFSDSDTTIQGSGILRYNVATGNSHSFEVNSVSKLAISSLGLNFQGNDLNNGGVIFLTEQAEAEADVAGKGQIWVDTATPNVAFFTDDAGTDFRLSFSTSAQLAAMVSDETGSGALVFGTSPTFITPALGTPASGVATNLTGTSLITGLGAQTQALDMSAEDITDIAKLTLSTATVATIATGSIAYARTHMQVDTEAGACADDLDFITGVEIGDTLILYSVSSARDTTVKDSTSGSENIRTAGDFTFTNFQDKMTLFRGLGADVMTELSRSDNA